MKMKNDKSTKSKYEQEFKQQTLYVVKQRMLGIKEHEPGKW